MAASSEVGWSDTASEAREARRQTCEWALWEPRDIELVWLIFHDLVRYFEYQEEVMFSQEVMASEVSQFELTRFTIWL